jgi:hypothetical protein
MLTQNIIFNFISFFVIINNHCFSIGFLGKYLNTIPNQEYPKPASVYGEFDESARSERCVRIVASGRK